jgi:hypothetical protein
MKEHLALILAVAGLALLVPSVITILRHPEWRQGEE